MARPKVQYETLFEPWDWEISASSYRSEFIKLVDIEGLSTSILATKIGQTGYSYIIDGKGNVLVHPSLAGANILDYKDINGRPFIREMLERKRGTITYAMKAPNEAKVRERVAVFEEIPELGWLVATTLYSDEMYAPLGRLKSAMVAAAAATLMLCGLMLYLVGVAITRPLRALMDRIDTVWEELHLGHRVSTTGEAFKSLDEVVILTKNFDSMATGLQVRDRQLAEHREGLKVLWERAERRAAQAEADKVNVSGTLDAIMDCAPAFVLVVNKTGTIRFINRVLPHHKKEDVIGSHWTLYVPPEEHERSEARLRSVIETGVSVTYETAINGPDGTIRWFTSHMGPLRDGDQGPGAVVVAQDITELRQTQAEFAAAQRMVAVGTLASGVAHELNTPIQFVSDSVHFLSDAAQDVFGLLEKLQEVCRLAAEGTPDDDLQQAIASALEAEEDADLPYLRNSIPKAFERCVDGLERIATIVRSMKEFAHPSQREMAPVDLNRAVQNTVTIARNEYKYVAQLETDFGEIPPVTCHIHDINQVVLNLIVNAAHAIGDVVKDSGNKGTIAVRTAHEGDYAVISVRDTGTGIAEAVAHRIFEPFFTTKEVGKGTGQGLALAWAAIRDKHGGDLTFETKVGEGTTFFIRLPIAGKGSR